MDIVSLQPRIRKVASHLAQEYNWAETPDEWAWTMNLTILERAKTDREFMCQTLSYTLRFAAYRARDHYRALFSAKKTGVNNRAREDSAASPQCTPGQ